MSMWLDLPRHFPHKCHTCHRGGIEASPFFEDDLTYMVWEDGDKRNYRLYTCATCVRAMLAASGCPMNLNDLHREVTDLTGEANRVRAELVVVAAERDELAQELATTLAEHAVLSADDIARKVAEHLRAQPLAAGKPGSTEPVPPHVPTIAPTPGVYTAPVNRPQIRRAKKKV